MIDPEKLELSWESHTVKQKRQKKKKPGASQRNSSLGKIPHSSRNSQSTFKERLARRREGLGSAVHTLPRDHYYIYPLASYLSPNLMQILKVDLGAPGALCLSSPLAILSLIFPALFTITCLGDPRRMEAEPGL